MLALLKNAVPLSTIRVTIPAILYTFTKVAFGTYNLSLSILEKFSTVENLFTTKEEKTKLSLAQINNVNLNTITEPGFYTSSGWSNNIVNLPAELNHNEGRAFYLLVFALENGAYCQQILYSFKGLIFYRAITGANSAFTQWKKLT